MNNYHCNYLLAGWELELSGEENDAIVWRIGRDCHAAGTDAPNAKTSDAHKSVEEEYITFAFNFYTRNRQSIDDVVMQYRIYFKEQRARQQAEAFMNDILSRIRSTPVAEAA